MNYNTLSHLLSLPSLLVSELIRVAPDKRDIPKILKVEMYRCWEDGRDTASEGIKD